MSLKSIVTAVLLSVAAAGVNAANFSFAGDFQYDNDVQLFGFTVGTDSTVSLRSWSYAGGVNAAGQAISRGGFDPILTLFNSAGLRIGQQDDGGCGRVAQDSVTRECWDTLFTMNLAAGDYTASIQQFNNFSLGSLSAGFAYDGSQFRQFRNGFVDEDGDKRNGSWAFDILNVNAAELPPPADVPEPASIALMSVALAGLMAARRRQKV
jgi:hypothetical protein